MYGRRLTDYVIVDASGAELPLDRFGIAERLSLKGVVHPAAGPLTKTSGRRLTAALPLAGWGLDFGKDGATVRGPMVAA